MEVSAEARSFHDNLLEYPQYTRPEVFRGKAVPEVLLSGHHKNIEEWRRKESIRRTLERRPDLPPGASLTLKGTSAPEFPAGGRALGSWRKSWTAMRLRRSNCSAKGTEISSEEDRTDVREERQPAQEDLKMFRPGQPPSDWGNWRWGSGAGAMSEVKKLLAGGDCTLNDVKVIIKYAKARLKRLKRITKSRTMAVRR